MLNKRALKKTSRIIPGSIRGPLARKSRRAIERYRSRNKRIIYHIDSPINKNVGTKKVIIEGWIIPAKNNIRINSLRARVDTEIFDIDYPNGRPDVHREHKALGDLSLKSGFSVEVELNNSPILLEVDLGRGFEVFSRLNLEYLPEESYKSVYNSRLAENYAEHLNLVDNRKKYFFEENSKAEYRRERGDPRLIATYLPQFHPIKENDETWGKGFTEWTNVTAGTPRFIGHNQPFLPKDLGYYDLRREESILAQINLAKQHGIYGFCFYYYWFSGHKLLEKPINSFIKNKDWDFNFAICWANENWTKRWDGRDQDVIVAQQYLPDDPLNFIKDVELILNDPRYINEDGKPVLMVYRASELKNPGKYTEVWREYFRNKYNKELHLVSFISFEDKDPRDYGFDAALDFAPLGSFFKTEKFPDKKYPFISTEDKLIDPNFEGQVVDYRQIALNKDLDNAFNFPTYKCVMPSWDNDARKKGKGFVFQNSSPDIYGEWLLRVLSDETKKSESPLVFINAWNEWAEGAVLEPSMHLGHAVLNRTAEVLSLYGGNKKNQETFPLFGYKSRNPKTKLAVIAHLFYPEKWQEMNERLKLIDQPYDLFISLNIKDEEFKKQILMTHPNACLEIVPNRGRDILPFVIFATKIKKLGYQYILKLHTKKSKHRSNGNEWFEDLLSKLIPDTSTTKQIIDTLQKEKTLIGPFGHFVSLNTYMGSNREALLQLLTKMYNKKTAEKTLSRTKNYGYFAGTMFWAHIDAISPLLDLHLLPDDFESEKGQIDGTSAHAVERAISLMPQVDNTLIYKSSSRGVEAVNVKDLINKYKYAP